MSFKLWKRKYILKKNYEKKEVIQVILSKNNVAVSFLSTEFNVFDDRPIIKKPERDENSNGCFDIFSLDSHRLIHLLLYTTFTLTLH